MSLFTVANIVDGDTFDVTPSWRWEGESGYHVRPTGYNAPEMSSYSGEQIKQKLARLIEGKSVELGSAYKIDRGRLVCDVYYQGKNLAEYFTEFH